MINSVTNAQAVSAGGSFQAVPNPNQFGSLGASEYVSAVYGLSVPLAHGTAAYVAYLPANATMLNFNVIATTAFSTGATLSVGSTVSGVDIINAESITSQSSVQPLIPAVNNAVKTKAGVPLGVNPVYITLGGAPAAGAGFLVIEFINANNAKFSGEPVAF